MLRENTRAMVTVAIDIKPEYEEEFNRWYNEEHVPERAHCPGFVSARRFMAVNSTPKYLAVYEVENLAVLQSEAYLKLLERSPWTLRIRPQFARPAIRTVYREITEIVDFKGRRVL